MNLELIIKIIVLLTAIIALASAIVSLRKNKDKDHKTQTTDTNTKKTSNEWKDLGTILFFALGFPLLILLCLILFKWLLLLYKNLN